MSGEDELRELSRLFVDGFNRRDAETLIRASHPRIVYYPSALVGERRCYAGHDGLRDWVAQLVAGGAQFEARVHEIRVLSADRFAVISEVWAGDERVSPSALIGTVRDGGIYEARGYLTELETLVRLGLIPAR